ncbi:MAG: exodeoxyribonuclease VII small subunit [Myxococcales bacterium]|nr:exodeoxyribonuclease VII small subunit [Myxococcales bacterium]
MASGSKARQSDGEGGLAEAAGAGSASGAGDASGAGSSAASTEPSVSFEASAERLTDIVKVLESGEISLEESLRLFEEGVRVARAAQHRLDRAERRVEELLGLDAEGEPEKRPID